MKKAKSQIISLIAAMGTDRGLGFGNRLSWRLPDDMRRFKETTTGHAVIMGRKTYETIGKPLPNRFNIVITRNPLFSAPGCQIVGSLSDALLAADGGEVFIMGGGEIYALAIERAHRLYLTHVGVALEADAYFPEFDEADFNVTACIRHGVDEKHAYPFEFRLYERRGCNLD